MHRLYAPNVPSRLPTPAAANVITVGSESRANILASLLDKNGHGHPENAATSDAVSRRTSSRGFITYTGTFNGVPVSIIMINMGYPNMDFLVRELREVTQGPLRIIRLGSCAGLRPDLPVGTVAVASEGSVFIRQNPDAWQSSGKQLEGMTSDSEVEKKSAKVVEPYTFHGVAKADEELSRALMKELGDALGVGGAGEGGVVGCLNASADSFYSSQGKCDTVVFNVILDTTRKSEFTYTFRYFVLYIRYVLFHEG